MKSPGNPNTPGRYDVLRQEHARAIGEGAGRGQPPDGAQSVPPHSNREYERWRQQTIARIENDRAKEQDPPPRSADVEFEKLLDARQKQADEIFKLEFGEDAERSTAWRNKERRVLMQRLPANEEARALGDLRHREQWLRLDRLKRAELDKGAEP